MVGRLYDRGNGVGARGRGPGQRHFALLHRPRRGSRGRRMGSVLGIHRGSVSIHVHPPIPGHTMINRHFGLSLLASLVVGAGWWFITRDPFVVTLSVVLGTAL